MEAHVTLSSLLLIF